MNEIYLYLISPLHTGGATQEGNLLGIARESHTGFPYIPSSTIRGKLRSIVDDRVRKTQLFGSDLQDLKDDVFLEEYQHKTSASKKMEQLEQGQIWIGDASLLWLPVPSMSHGVIWVSCPMLLARWQRIKGDSEENIPTDYSTNLSTGSPIYLKDAIIPSTELKTWGEWEKFLPNVPANIGNITRLLVLPDKHCGTLIQMSLWRQVKIKLDEHKTVDGGFRYEEAIPPDTLMYFPWGVTSQSSGKADEAKESFQEVLNPNDVLLQIGGQESLGRGFVRHWFGN
jgi:CRISPR-associated protein Cmr4